MQFVLRLLNYNDYFLIIDMAWSHKQQQQQMNMYFKLYNLWMTMDKIYVELQKGALSFQ